MLLFIFLGIFAFACCAPKTINWDIKEGKFKVECPVPSKDVFVGWYRKNEATQVYEEVQFSDTVDFPDFVSILFKAPVEGDTGNYMCKNILTDAKIADFNLNFRDVKITITTQSPDKISPPVWVYKPKSSNIIDSSRSHAVLPCRAIGENVKVTAYRLSDTGKIIKKYKNQGIAIISPTGKDSGNYYCKAENAGGSIEFTFQVLVKVNGKPSEWADWGPCDAQCGYGIQSRKRECNNPAPANGGSPCRGKMTERQSCRERSCSSPRLTKFGFEITDDELIMDCNAKGIPTPSVTWKFDGRRMDSSYDSSNPKMKIPLHRAQSGSYSCTVRNQVGYFTMYISIDL